MSELLGLVLFFAAAFIWAALRRDPKPTPPPYPWPSPFQAPRTRPSGGSLGDAGNSAIPPSLTASRPVGQAGHPNNS